MDDDYLKNFSIDLQEAIRKKIKKKEYKMISKIKTYRVKGYETVMYYVDVKAENKSDAYSKAMDVNVLDWEQKTTVGLWDNGGFKIKKKDIEEIK